MSFLEGSIIILFIMLFLTGAAVCGKHLFDRLAVPAKELKKSVEAIKDCSLDGHVWDFSGRVYKEGYNRSRYGHDESKETSIKVTCTRCNVTNTVWLTGEKHNSFQKMLKDILKRRP